MKEYEARFLNFSSKQDSPIKCRIELGIPQYSLRHSLKEEVPLKIQAEPCSNRYSLNYLPHLEAFCSNPNNPDICQLLLDDSLRKVHEATNGNNHHLSCVPCLEKQKKQSFELHRGWSLKMKIIWFLLGLFVSSSD